MPVAGGGGGGILYIHINSSEAMRGTVLNRELGYAVRVPSYGTNVRNTNAYQCIPKV